MTRKTKAICESENKDFNPQTEKCVKRCKHGEERNDNFKCKQTRKTKFLKTDFGGGMFEECRFLPRRQNPKRMRFLFAKEGG